VIASLAMYPLPAIRTATNDLWVVVRRNLVCGPDKLEWKLLTPQVWRDPDMLVAQCCGWPLVTEFARTMAVVGTFDHAVPDSSQEGAYRSVIITATDRSLDDLLDDPATVAAVNDYASLSGWVSLRHVWNGRDLKSVVTGGHLESVLAIGVGEAQVASIDAVSWSLFEEFEPSAVDGLSVIGHGPQVPCLPIVVPLRYEDRVPELRAAFATAVADPALAQALRTLRIRGFVPRSLADYTSLLTLID
jgi:ABC-type phosphate/phosphonate transport system substrate-binding protein